MKLAPTIAGLRHTLAGAAVGFARVMDENFWGRWGPTGFSGSQRLGAGGGGGRTDGMDSVWTHVAVSRIADSIRQLPWRLALPDNTFVERGPLFALLSRPNALQDWAMFCESLVKTVLGPGGVAAVILDYGRDNPAGEMAPLAAGTLPVAMRVDSADSLTPIWAQGPAALWPTLVGYEYRTRSETGHGATGGRVVRLPAHQVVTVRIPDSVSLNPLVGLSPRAATGRSLDLDRALERYATDYFNSGAHPSREYSTDAPMLREQRKSLERDLDKHGVGALGRRGARVLPKGLKPVQAQSSMRDAAHPELSDDARERVLGAHGVSPIVAGIVDSANRSNSDAQMLMFLSVAVFSLASRIAGALTHGLIAAHDWPAAEPSGKRAALSRSALAALDAARRSAAEVCRGRRTLARGLAGLPLALRAGFSGAPEQDLVMYFDGDSHPVIMESKLVHVPQVVPPLCDNGATLNEVMDLLDVALERNPAGDVARVPFSKAPAEVTDARPEPAPAPEAKPNAEGAEDAEKTKGSLPESLSVSAPSANSALHSCADSLVARFGGLRAAAIRGVAERHRASWRPLERVMQARYEAHVARQARETIARLKKEIDPAEMAPAPGPAPGPERAIGAERVARIVVDLAQEQDRVEAVARPALRDAARLGARQGLEEGGVAAAEAVKAADVLVDDPILRVKVRESVGRFRLIEESRREDAMRIIREAFEPNEGEAPRTFADLVTDLEQFYDGARGNAKRTATTETGKVLNGSRHEGMRAAGVPGKHWLTTSGNPRASHAAAEAEYGETAIAIDQPFRVGESLLMFPGDPAGAPEEIIQCYCVSIAALELGEDAGEDKSLGWMGVTSRRRGARFASLDAALTRYAALSFVTFVTGEDQDIETGGSK